MRLDRLIAILEAVAVSGRPVTLVEVVERTKLPKPTCDRLIRILNTNGFLDSDDPKSGYVLGDRLIRLALIGRADEDVRSVAGPLLRKAAGEANLTTYLARFRNPIVETIHIETPPSRSLGHIYPGLNERPLHACACAKAIAAFAPRRFQDEIIAAPNIRFNERTKTTAEELRKEFATIRRRGYAECDEEIDIGVISIAAPIHIRRVGAIFSVATVAPVSCLDPKARAQTGRRLIALSELIGAAIQLYTPMHNLGDRTAEKPP